MLMSTKSPDTSCRPTPGDYATNMPTPSARALPQVGYQRTLSAEGILSLAPDLVLASEAAGPPAVLDQVRSAGVPVRIVVRGGADGAQPAPARRRKRARSGHRPRGVASGRGRSSRAARLHRIAVLKQGRLWIEGPPEMALAVAVVETVFAVRASVVRHPQRPDRLLVVADC